MWVPLFWELYSNSCLELYRSWIFLPLPTPTTRGTYYNENEDEGDEDKDKMSTMMIKPICEFLLKIPCGRRHFLSFWIEKVFLISQKLCTLLIYEDFENFGSNSDLVISVFFQLRLYGNLVTKRSDPFRMCYPYLLLILWGLTVALIGICQDIYLCILWELSTNLLSEDIYSYWTSP